MMKLFTISILIHIIKCEFNNTITLNLTYSSVYSLLNGIIFIICESKSIVYDSSLTQEKYTFDISSNVNFTANADLNEIALSEFLQEDGSEYIITIIKNYIYVFDLKKNDYFFYDKTNELNGNDYSLIAYEKNDNNYKFIIGKLKKYFVYLTYYQINSETKNISTLKNFNLMIEDSSGNKRNIFFGISCEIMKYSNPSKILTCFLITQVSLELSSLSFDPDEEFKILNTYSYYKIKGSSASYLKSVTNEDKTKAFICYGSDGNKGYCHIFNIKTNNFSDPISTEKCRYNPASSKLYFFKETNTFLFGCGNDGFDFHFIKVSEDFNFEKFDYIQYGDSNIDKTCYGYKSLSILYNDEKYSLVLDTFGWRGTKTKNYIFPDDFQNSMITSNSTKSSSSSFSSSSSQSSEKSTSSDNFSDEDNIFGECPENKPYKNLTNMECIKLCQIEDILSNKCEINKVTDNNMKLIDENIINVLNIINGSNYVIIKGGKIVLYQIGNIETIKNSSDKNISSIDFGECENILKQKYDLNDLILFKKDINLNNTSNIYVLYDIYNLKTKQKIDLTICEKTKINIFTPVSVSESFLSLYKNVTDSGYDITNPNDSFYNDVCIPFTSQNNTDVTLNDRKIYYYNENINTCQFGCSFINFDPVEVKINCECQVKQSCDNKKFSDLKFIALKLSSSFSIKQRFSNLKILKCFSLFIKFKNHFINYGSIIFIILIILFIGICVFYHINRKKYILNLLKNVISFNPFPPNKQKETKKIKISSSFISNSRIKISTHKISINVKNNNHNNDDKIKRKNKNKIQNRNDSLVDSNNSKKILKNIKIERNKKNKIKMQSKSVCKKITKKNSYIEAELNKLSYEKAILIDKRTYLQYYWSLLKNKHILIFAFYTKNDYNLKCSKIALLIIILGTNLVINGMFFYDKTMHKIYVSYGVFNFINNIPQIIYSTLISSTIITLLRNFALTQCTIIKLKKTNKIKVKKEFFKECNFIKIKLSLFFCLGLLILLFFWYFITLFCIVFRNTQIIFLKNSLFSLISSLVYPFGYNLLPGIFRIPSLHNKGKSKFLYQMSGIIALI